MIKFEKDVLAMLQALEQEGFETYATGECIMDYAAGITPEAWTLVTKAAREDVLRILPEVEAAEGEEGALRVDRTYEEEDDKGVLHTKGYICDVYHLGGTIEEEISQYGYTACAIADNPARQLVDPYDGMEANKKKLLKTIGDADELFEKEPIRMMQAMRYVSAYGMDLSVNLHDAILRNWRRLLDHDIAPIRVDLEDVLTGPNAGKALNMMFDTGLMAVIFGEEVARKISAQEGKQFIELCEGIDKVKPFRLRRLGLLYTVLNEKRGLAAIDRMQFDEKTAMHLHDAMTEMIKIQFIRNAPELKQYVFSMGMDRYNYVHNLSKAQRIVYDQPELRIEARNHMMREIRRNGEPLFVEDLVIDANDIMEAGITDDPARAEELLTYVIAKVHQDPRNNDRKYLLKMAKKFNKSKFKVRTRYVHWLR